MLLKHRISTDTCNHMVKRRRSRRSTTPVKKAASTRRSTSISKRVYARKRKTGRQQRRGGPKGPVNYGRGTLPVLAKVIHIPGRKKISALASHVFKQMGDTHILRRYWSWKSSHAAGNNSCCWRIAGPYVDTSTAVGATSTNWIYSPTELASGSVNQNFGVGSYAGNVPTHDKYLLLNLKMKLCIDQVNENGRLKVVIAKPVRGQYQAGSINPFSSFSTAMDDPTNFLGWKVYWSREFKYERYGESGTTFNRNREIFINIPCNHLVETRTSADGTQLDDWDNQLTNPRYLHMFVISDDATTVDSEYFQFKLFCEWKFVMPT